MILPILQGFSKVTEAYTIIQEPFDVLDLSRNPRLTAGTARHHLPCLSFQALGKHLGMHATATVKTQSQQSMAHPASR